MKMVGRKPWTSRVPPALIQRAGELLDARQPAIDVYRSLKLAQWVSEAVWRRWVAQRKRGLATREPPVQGGDPGPESGNALASMAVSGGASHVTPEAVLMRLTSGIASALESGDMQTYVLPAAVNAIVRVHELAIEQERDKRAEEKHAAWKREVIKTVEQVAEQASGLTPELVAEIRTKVLGL